MIFVYLTPEALLELKDSTIIDCSAMNVFNLNKLVNRINFLSKFNAVSVHNAPVSSGVALKDQNWQRPVYFLVDQKKVSPEIEVKVYGTEQKLVKPKKSFFKSKEVFKWYLYWLKKGVFTKDQQDCFSKL